MRRERVIQGGTCHHLVARVAKGESKGLRRYDKENLLWQSTVALKSDPVGSQKEWSAGISTSVINGIDLEMQYDTEVWCVACSQLSNFKKQTN